MRPLLLATVWAHLASSVLLAGALSMLVLAGPSDRPSARRWEEAVIAWSRLLVLIALGSGIGWLLARTALFEGRPDAALEPRAVVRALLDTRAGLIWLARHGLLVVLAAFLAIRANLVETRDWIAARGEALVLAMLALALLSGTSHAAAVTPGTDRALAVDVIHLLGTAVWIGSLGPLALLLRAASRERGADCRPYAVLAVRRFSRVALVVVMVLTASGVMNAIVQVESMAGLLGTEHGRLLVAKLCLLVPIVFLAAVNRVRLVPALSGPAVAVGRPAMRRLAVFVALEAALGIVVLALVAAMTLTTPARHAQPGWPLPFRFSLEAAFDVPTTRSRTLIGSQLVVLGIVAVVTSLLARRRRAPTIVGALMLAGLGVGVALPAIVVAAYPTTYRRPPVPYHAVSIASGLSIYREHCARCHGATGAGDGPSVVGDGQPLADLRSPSASRRLAGDMYWLIAHGVPARGMPGFESRLPEPQRWDIINAIRALGAAEASKTIGRQVQPDRPWLVAPDFAIAVGPVVQGALRDYRGRRMVLVVLYGLPRSRARLAQLARGYDVMWVMGVEIIAVPTSASPAAIRELGSSPPVLFPVVTDAAADIVETYRLFAPGDHAELLIDRQGYIRAIWSGDAADMPDTTSVLGQVERLNEETTVVPFPDEHVH